MSDLAICDHFKWSLNDIYSLTIREHISVVRYLNKLEAKNKSAMRKSKRGRKR